MKTVRTPLVNQAMGLIEMAYTDAGDKLVPLGWADSSVADTPAPVNFTVDPVTDNQEGAVLIVAVRVPHPDEMNLSALMGSFVDSDPTRR